MKLEQEERNEYEKFMIGLAHKVQEMQQDFDKLSIENKIRLENDIKKALMLKGMMGISEYFNQWR